jgi:hypothetical protein
MPIDMTQLLASLRNTASMAGPGSIAFDLSQKRLATAKDRSAKTRALIFSLMGNRGLAGGMGVGGGGGFSPSGNPRGRGLTTITAPNGQRVTVAANYASRFTGLLNDLWKAGYHMKSVGGYNYRNIAGTNTLSKHATGEAIDIDPQPNRGNRLGGGGSRYGYFDPRVINGLIRKWGLDWGGNWSNPDPMHFSTGG